MTNTAAVTIRRYESAADRAQLTALIAGLQDFGRLRDGRMPSGASMACGYLAALEHQCRHHAGCIFVADDQGRLLGFVAIAARVPAGEPADGLAFEARLVDLYVIDEARGRGVGRHLLQRAEAFAREHGATWLRVSVFAWNDAAHALYRRAGYGELELTLEKPLTS